jgi:hypothetical protein
MRGYELLKFALVFVFCQSFFYICIYAIEKEEEKCVNGSLVFIIVYLSSISFEVQTKLVYLKRQQDIEINIDPPPSSPPLGVFLITISN